MTNNVVTYFWSQYIINIVLITALISIAHVTQTQNTVTSPSQVAVTGEQVVSQDEVH